MHSKHELPTSQGWLHCLLVMFVKQLGDLTYKTFLCFAADRSNGHLANQSSSLQLLGLSSGVELNRALLVWDCCCSSLVPRIGARLCSVCHDNVQLQLFGYCCRNDECTLQVLVVGRWLMFFVTDIDAHTAQPSMPDSARCRWLCIVLGLGCGAMPFADISDTQRFSLVV